MIVEGLQDGVSVGAAEPEAAAKISSAAVSLNDMWRRLTCSHLHVVVLPSL